RGLLQVPLFSLEVDLGCQLFTHLIEDLAIRELGNPERDAAVVEKPSDFLQQVELQRQPVLDAGLEDLEHPALGKILLTAGRVSKRHHDSYAGLGQRRGIKLDAEAFQGAEFAGQGLLDRANRGQGGQRLEALKMKPRLEGGPAVAARTWPSLCSAGQRSAR